MKETIASKFQRQVLSKLQIHITEITYRNGKNAENKGWQTT